MTNKLRALTTDNQLIYFSIYQIREYYPNKGTFAIGIEIAKDSERFIECKCGTEEWFTGWLDFNNQEIYIGDILQWDYYCMNAHIVEKSTVIWDENDNCFDLQIYNKPDFCSFEIIGNIHENPEVCEKGKNDK